MLNHIMTVARSNPKFAQGTEAMEQDLQPTARRVIVVVATDVERDAVIEAAYGRLINPLPRRFHGDHSYIELGVHGGCELLLVRSEPGSGGPSGSLLTVYDAMTLKPTAVIMVGIAFGAIPDKQRIGDVLVSTQIFPYELQRVGEDASGTIKIIPRGPKPDASPRLLDRFRNGEVDWKVAKVRFGLVFSGEKLVDSSTFVQQLLELEPEGIGGEMESAGLYAAAFKGKVDWIMAKAICDWGMNKNNPNKDRDQKIAAKNAADFVFHVIRVGGLAHGIQT
jgi:nucleoside phosphorylase